MMIITKTDIIKNGIWLTFPPLLFSLSLMTLLPTALTPAQFNEGIPDVLLNIESIGRILVFAMPAFFSIGISTKTQTRGLALYLAGVTLYYLSYGSQNFFPESDWSTSAIGFAASAYTNVFWMIGLGLLGENSTSRNVYAIGLFFILCQRLFLLSLTPHTQLSIINGIFNGMQLFTFVSTSVIFIVLFYLKLLRPWQLRWGATDDEVNCAMSGDDIVQKPNFVATRAVSIEAPPTEVWKWIIQIGSGRAGFYSIDLIDNANVPSSRDIIPKYQRIEQDYFIPFTPNHKNGMWVKDYREFEYILWWDRKGNGTWGWFLQQTEAGNTRLITRLRTKYDFSFPWIIYYILYDFGDIIMMSKCMSGIKERAENYIRSPILGNS